MKTLKPYLFWILSVFALTSAGCVAVVAGGAAAGTVAYVRGELSAVLEADMNTSAAAVENAREKLELFSQSHAKDQLSAKYVWRTADDRRVQVNLKKQTDNSTELYIRVGVFGDEALSRLIYDEIRAGL
jgi:hypothetical protein